MVDRYSFARGRVARKIRQWKTGTVLLVRKTLADPSEETPWQPGEVTATHTYELDAVVQGVTEQYVDGTLIVASDLMVVASPKAMLIAIDDQDVDEPSVVDLVPAMEDTIVIDSAEREPKSIVPAPSAGEAAVFQIFVAS